MATTTGFVHRSTVVNGSTCLWVGPSPTSVEALFVVIGAAEPATAVAAKLSVAATLIEAQVSGRLVEVAHGDNSGEITSCTLPLADPTTSSVQLDAIEVTQAVQDLAQSVPLLAGKRTVVRVYLSRHAGSPANVQGVIAVRQHPLDPPVMVASENTATLDPANAGNVTLLRTDENRSLNFVLDPAQTAEGPLTIELAEVTRPNGTLVDVEVRHQRTVFFHRTPPLRLRIVGIRYRYQASATSEPVTHIPANIDYSRILSWLHRAYPVAQVVSSQVVVDAPGGPIFDEDNEFGCGTINAHVAAIRALDVDSGFDARTLYYGLVGDGGFFMRGCVGSEWVSCGPTGTATWGWDFDSSYGDWYAGHEIGHSLGRPHPGFCDQDGTDPQYPFPSGQLSNSDDGFCGFDTGDPLGGIALTSLPGTVWHDVMTYCDRQWLSPYTYRQMRLQLFAVDGQPAAAGSGPGAGAIGGGGGGRPDQRRLSSRVSPRTARTAASTAGAAGERRVSVVANVNLTRRGGAIRYVNPVENLRPSVEDPTSAVWLVVRGGNGEELRRMALAVTVNPERDTGDDQRALLDAVIAVPGDAAAVELHVGGQLADTFQAGAAPGLREARVAARTPGGLAVAAEADREVGGPPPTYAVQVSRDGGTTWETVAVGLHEPSFELDRSNFAPGTQVQARIVASSGFDRAVVATETIRL